MEELPLLRHDADGVATLMLNRPHKRNALDIETFVQLERQLTEIAAEPERIGAVFLRGAGSCICAGADISRPTRPPRHNFQASVVEQLATLPQPGVAAVHRYCFTGGLELALAPGHPARHRRGGGRLVRRHLCAPRSGERPAARRHRLHLGARRRGAD